MIDVTDPTAPVVLNRRLHEQGAGHHPIRYHHEAQPLDGDPSVMLVTDGDMHNGCGGAGGVVAVRLTPPANCRSGSSRSGPRPRPARSTSFSSEGSKVY